MSAGSGLIRFIANLWALAILHRLTGALLVSAFKSSFRYRLSDCERPPNSAHFREEIGDAPEGLAVISDR